MLNGTTSEIQQRKLGPKKCKKISILTLKYVYFLVQKVIRYECKNQLNKKLGLLPQKLLLFLKGEKMQQNLLQGPEGPLFFKQPIRLSIST